MRRNYLYLFNERWNELGTKLAEAKKANKELAVRQRAEIAASVPVYATTGDLPAAGQLGRLAAVTATGNLYFDNGSAWGVVGVTY